MVIFNEMRGVITPTREDAVAFEAVARPRSRISYAAPSRDCGGIVVRGAALSATGCRPVKNGGAFLRSASRAAVGRRSAAHPHFPDRIRVARSSSARISSRNWFCLRCEAP